ncbi:MAG: hypothetical protein C0469_08190 [Cyanobacteria bacterium DS2.3.42]|nr:hypothetical protein [Cyanobacteria bacterium DS2.3.42]
MKIALILCIPLVFEITVIATSIGLLEEIDQARLSRQKMGRVIYSYVDTISAIISDYIGFAAFMDGRRSAPRHSVNAQFERTSKALEEFRHNLTAAKVRFMDLKRMVTSGRNLVSDQYLESLTQEEYYRGSDSRYVLLDAIDAAAKRVNERLENLKMRENAEKKLIQRMNVILFAALTLSLVLTLGLCYLFGKIIVERIAYLKENAHRLAKDTLLLPPLEGDDEIVELDKKFRHMAQALSLAEARNQRILENSIDVICALDVDLKFRKVSDSSQVFLNIPAHTLVGTPVFDIIASDWHQETRQKFEEARAVSAASTELNAVEFENETLSHEGSLLPSKWSVQWSPKDELFICIVHDISERKKAEAKRQDLLAVVSHDLRTPLTAAKLGIEILREDGKNDKQILKELNTANDSVNYVVSVTNDLIDLLRLQKSRKKFKVKLSTVQSALELAHHTLENAGIAHRYETQDMGDIYVTVDEEYFSRVIFSLANHIRASLANAVIKVSAHRDTLNSNGSLCFRIEPVEFATLDVLESKLPSARSWEISLKLCQEIISQLQGNLVESAGGKLIFEIVLPVARVD